MNQRGTALVALASGALLTLAFPEPDVWSLAWVAFAPTLYLTRGSGPKRSALVWLAFGAGFFGTLLYWISVVGYLAWAVLVVVETLFIVAFGALWGWASARTGPFGRIAVAGGSWATLEYLRSLVPFGGFTWGQLAQSQHDTLWLLQWASIGGGIFLALVIVATNAALAEIVGAARAKRLRTAALAALVMAVALAGPLLINPQHMDGFRLTVAVVQGNVDPLAPHDFAKDLRILNRHVKLTESIDEEVDLVVWPESAAAIDPHDPVVPPLLERAARAVDAPMIIGGSENVGDPEHRYRVMAWEVSPAGEIVDRYQKTHLVPFGEFVPAREALDWLPILDQVPRDAIPGSEETIFDIDGTPVAPIISFEGDFGTLARTRIDAGGRLLVVATNTSTWERSWASAQHVAFSQVRAAENGVWVVHAALSGISAFIDPHGTNVASTPLWEATTLVRRVGVASSPTFYARTGDWLPVVCVALIAGLAIMAATRSRREQRTPSG